MDWSSQQPRTVFEQVKEVILQLFGGWPERVTREARLLKDIGIDSFSLEDAELVMAIEETFGIIIPDAAAEQMETVGDLVDYVEGRLAPPGDLCPAPPPPAATSSLRPLGTGSADARRDRNWLRR